MVWLVLLGLSLICAAKAEGWEQINYASSKTTCTDAGNNKIQMTKSISNIEACRNLCAANDDCTAVFYRTKNGNCNLYKNCEETRTMNNSGETWRKKTDPSCVDDWQPKGWLTCGVVKQESLCKEADAHRYCANTCGLCSANVLCPGFSGNQFCNCDQDCEESSAWCGCPEALACCGKEPEPTNDNRPAVHDGKKCIKNGDTPGDCCGFPDEITCMTGYKKMNPNPDVCSGCPWCDDPEWAKTMRSFKCIPDADFVYSKFATLSAFGKSKDTYCGRNPGCHDIDGAQGWGCRASCFPDCTLGMCLSECEKDPMCKWVDFGKATGNSAGDCVLLNYCEITVVDTSTDYDRYFKPLELGGISTDRGGITARDMSFDRHFDGGAIIRGEIVHSLHLD